MSLNNATYDRLKWIAQIGLPAIGVFYFAIAGIWGLPDAEQVNGTILAADTLLGVILGISSRNYQQPIQGSILVDQTNPKTVAVMEFHEQDPAKLISQLAGSDTITFKVNHAVPDPIQFPASGSPPPAS